MAFQFKIQLKDIIAPPVWRRLSVPEQFTFYRFHKAIQVAFGWGNTHLFQFSPGGYNSHPVITIPNPEWDAEPVLDGKKTRLSDIFSAPKQKFVYLYDLGDNWIHTVTLEKITEEKILRADCIAGKGACPPEDCGGSWGYTNLKDILCDLQHPEYTQMKEWVGLAKSQNWDAEYFNLERTRAAIQRV
jgi:hypothetical protein